MNILKFHRICSEHKDYPDSLVIHDQHQQYYILDPSLNAQAILSYLKASSSVASCELWLSSNKVESAPYINAFAQKLHADIYAPFEYLPAFRMFSQQSKALGLCGVYTPRIKSDLKQHLTMWNQDSIALYPLSQSYMLHFKQAKFFWYHPQFISTSDENIIDEIIYKIK